MDISPGKEIGLLPEMDSRLESSVPLLFFAGIIVCNEICILRYYNTSVYPLDFVMNAEQSTRYINLFFERNTEGRVPHILSQVPSPSTNLLLLNAIHFRGTLDMNMAQVEESRFVGRAGQDPFIMLEARKARVRYGVHDYLNCTAVEVPFRGGLISLVALLPNDPEGMAMLETRISAQRLTDIINSMQVKRVNFQVSL
ncbi:leukocyte elastase inhibitor A [Trichonephila clavipes]|nr:leukocyte elastase inhibitor A [Trichonephila clavipes]